jgi:hypothetical protein
VEQQGYCATAATTSAAAAAAAAAAAVRRAYGAALGTSATVRVRRVPLVPLVTTLARCRLGFLFHDYATLYSPPSFGLRCVGLGLQWGGANGVRWFMDS